jgi:hypothetical protein
MSIATRLAEIGPTARLLSVETMLLEFDAGDREFTLNPKCEFCGDKYDVATHDPGESPHVGEYVAYQFADIRFDAPGYERGETLSESGRPCKCCDYCKSDAEKRLLRDTLATVEDAIRAIPVSNATVSGRSRMIQIVSDLREEL